MPGKIKMKTTPAGPSAFTTSFGAGSDQKKATGEFEDFVQINLTENQGIHLPHILTHWTDGELNPRCTLYVWTLSGLEPKDIVAKVLDGGEVLRLSYPWPDPLHDAMRINGHKAVCEDSVKIVNMEKVIKAMKGGTFDAVITSVVDFNLGMRVEEQLYNEPLGRAKIAKGNKLLRFSKRIFNGKKSTTEDIPILIAKYEMMGIKDHNYKNCSTTESDYEDEEEEAFHNFGGNMDIPLSVIEDYFVAKKKIINGKISPSAAKKRRVGISGDTKKMNRGSGESVASTGAASVTRKTNKKREYISTADVASRKQSEEQAVFTTAAASAGKTASYPVRDIEQAAKDMLAKSGGRLLSSFFRTTTGITNAQADDEDGDTGVVYHHISGAESEENNQQYEFNEMEYDDDDL